MDKIDFLEQKDFCFVNSNLCLGNLAAATNLKMLKINKIKFILTVNSFSLPRKIYDLEGIFIKFIKVSDQLKEDILSNFEEAFHFIDCSREQGAVLVHCLNGVSRSAAFIISYLMKKNSWPLKVAYDYIKSRKPEIEPNSSFFAQLQLFEAMNCTLERNNIQFKMFNLFNISYCIQKKKSIPHYFKSFVKADPIQQIIKSGFQFFHCKKCRRVVAENRHLMPHFIKQKYNWKDKRWSKKSNDLEICKIMYFIEPLSWMQNILISLNGKLYCPNEKCKQKLGSFSWKPGCTCPCGTTVFPGFYLIPSRVDLKNY